MGRRIAFASIARPAVLDRVLRSLLSAAVTTLLAGCVLVESPGYPATWPARFDARGCDPILGTYWNEGTTEEGTKGESLFGLLGLSGVANRGGERITLTNPQKDVLEIRGLVDRRRYRLDNGPVRCRDGALEFRHASTDCSEGVCLRGSQTVALSRAADGTLVVKDLTVATGLFGPWPVHLRATRWYRFERAE